MNQNQLQCFLTVADTLNYASAAQLLNISQPAVSRQIMQLEKELGVTLFTRTTRNVVLTDSGKSFLIDARDIVNRMNISRIHLQKNETRAYQILNIACSDDSDLDFFTTVFRRCKTQFPELKPYVRVIPQKQILRLFRENELDVVLSYKQDIFLSREIEFLPLFQDAVCCVVSDQHPFAGRKSLTKSDLYSDNLIVCNSSAQPPAIQELQKELEYHHSTESLYYCDDIPVAVSLSCAGYGFTVLPDIQQVINIHMICIPIKDIKPITYGIYYKKNNTKIKMINRFLTVIQGEGMESTENQ